MRDLTNPTRLDRNKRAFTIIELLLVIAIIFILAALLLPALEQARARTRQTQCLSQLKQIGVAFHAFAHEHDGKFPFQTPTNAGGTYGLAGDSAFHFRPLSNELEVASLFWCPSDRERFKADNFRAFGSSNVSYFVTRTAEMGAPDDVLAGDRNVDVNSGPSPRWMAGLHDRKGNLLFADGHVEKSAATTLQQAFSHARDRASIVLPEITLSRPSSGRAPSAGSSGSGAFSGPSHGSAANGGDNSSSSGFAALQRVFGQAEPIGSGAGQSGGTGLRTIERSRTPPDVDVPLPLPSSNATSQVAKPIPPTTHPTSAPPRAVAAAEKESSNDPTSVTASVAPVARVPWWLLVLLLAVVSAALALLIIRRRSQPSAQ